MYNKKICVTGGRDHKDPDLVFKILDDCLSHFPHMHLIVGDCETGVDAYAKIWAEDRDVPHMIFKADWKTHKKSAGPIRNKEMLEFGFDLLLSFKGGRGTAHMTRITKQKGIDVRII